MECSACLASERRGQRLSGSVALTFFPLGQRLSGVRRWARNCSQKPEAAKDCELGDWIEFKVFEQVNQGKPSKTIVHAPWVLTWEMVGGKRDVKPRLESDLMEVANGCLRGSRRFPGAGFGVRPGEDLWMCGPEVDSSSIDFPWRAETMDIVDPGYQR